MFALSQSFGRVPQSTDFWKMFFKQGASSSAHVLRMMYLKITVEVVEKLLKTTNPSKAMGPDRIPNIILKTCAEELAPCLKNIFQKSVDWAL
jgi:hypothetical protein